MKRAFFFTWASGVLCLFGALANAGTIDSLSVLGPGTNHLTDGSDDILVPGTGYTGYDPSTQTYSGFGSGTIVGPDSILISAFNINEIANPSNPSGTLLPQPPYTQLAGLSINQVSSVTQSGDGTAGSPYSYTYQFGPVSRTAANLTAISTVSPTAEAALLTWSKNTLLGVYDGGQPVFNNSGYVDATVGQVVNSANLTWQFGLTGAPGTAWVANGLPTNDIQQLDLLAANTNVGEVNFSLDQTATTAWSSLLQTDVQSNLPGMAADLVDVNANTSFTSYTGTPVTPVPAGQYVWQVSDLTSARISVVPEPSGLLLMGTFFGVLALVGVCRRRLGH